MKKIIVIIPFILIFIQCLSFSQEKLNTRYGIYGHYQINMHSPDFNSLPDYPTCCPIFDEGSGSGIAIGLLYEMPIAKRLLLGFRAGYSSLNGELTKTEKTMMFAYGEIIEGEFEHSIDATIDNIGLEAYLSYGLTKQLFISGGLRAGFKMTMEADGAEKISNPFEGGTFMDEDGNDTRSRVRNEWSSEIDGASSIHLFGFAGLSYELPLNKRNTFILAPELRYYLGLNNLMEDVDWKVNTLNIGLALKYSPSKSKHAAPGESRLDADIRAYGIDKEGNENPAAKIVIEEFSSMQLHPLLTYVFFDKNSSEIPDRYELLNTNKTGDFQEENMYGQETMYIYYNVLNIIARRMIENPDAKIVLTGCNDNDESEKGNKQLSANRSDAVKKYLVDTWKISPSRITAKNRNLPATPSNIKEEDGLTENRRVEIYSDNWEIIKPVMAFDTLRETNPEILRFYPEVDSDEDIAAWNIKAIQRSKQLKAFNGNDDPDESYDWHLSENTPIYANTLDYSISVKDDRNSIVESETKSIPVEVITVQKKRSEKIRDREIQKYSLILFDFNTAKLGKNNSKIVDIIKGGIAPNSKVTITGHTDRIGSEEGNQSLSARRAGSVKDALGLKNVEAVGMGEENLLFNNDLPEGRFYCRTVNVIVETIYE